MNPPARSGWVGFLFPHAMLRPLFVSAVAAALLSAPQSLHADSVVVINEIHYHPADAGETLEFVELQNQMSIDIDLSGWTLDGVGNYTFPADSSIPAGGFVVIARNPAALAATTGHNTVFGPYTGALDNGGEPLTLRSHSGRVMDEVDYNDNHPWPVAPDGSGASLARIRRDTASDHSASWDASRQINGTPGAANVTGAPAVYADLELSEISAAGDSPFVVELRNTGRGSIALGGVSITTNTFSHAIASGSLAAGAHLSINLSFAPLSGDALFLAAPGSEVIDGVRVKTTPTARANDSARGEFLRPAAPTPNAPNNIVLEDQVVINEILYHHSPRQPQRAEIFGLESDWKYEQSGTDLGTAWREPDFDDSGWATGPGALGFESGALGLLINTTLSRFIGGIPPNQPNTYYFRKTIEWANPPAGLQLDYYIDDGAVFYLNGVEIHRDDMPGGAISYNTPANSGPDAVLRTVNLPAAQLVTGTNVLAVEVHQSTSTSSDLIFGLSASAEVPWAEDDQEFIELHNRSTTDTVDLSGWTLNGSADYTFPSGSSIAPSGYLVLARDAVTFAAEYPAVSLAGEYSGRLSNSSGHLVLRDALGNPADDVRYYDGKPWPGAADGGGSSLELRAPDADNSRPEAWAASDESGKSTWNTYTIRGTATNHLAGAPTNFQEVQFGLLAGGGECLIDDFSIIQDPDGAATQRIANGNFSSGANGWRFRGNHQHSSVENGELHLRASGNTEYMGNQIEATFASGSIIEGETYEISFRAKWLSGSPLLNSRLYFDRLASVTILDTPGAPGTPGAANSALETNIGPTCHGLAHSPVVPAAGQAVTVSVDADDPDGIASMRVRYSVNGGSFTNLNMTQSSTGRWSATVPGQSASALVQFYIRAQDLSGAISEYPAAGPDSRALYKVEDGNASGARQNVRIVMTTADANHMHDPTNVLSNERLPATIIYNESEIYYDVQGVRLKGSYVGRNVPRVGFNIAMNADRPFRGVHPKIAIDRSAGGTIADVAEIFLFQVYTKAGGSLPSRYDDIIQCIAPRIGQTGLAHLRLAGFDGDYLDSVYEDGSDGDMFENETLRWTTTTHNGATTGLKLPGNGFSEVAIGNDLGGDKESYRAGFFLMNNRSRDDHSRLIEFNETMALSGTAFSDAIGDVIDLDQWARVFAVQALMGHLDTYNRGIEHNIRYYVRPSDRRVLALPWDWDFIFQETNQSLQGDAGTFAKLLNIGSFRRAYYGHIRDVMNRSFNRTYMDPVIDHYGTVAGLSYAGVKSFITSRTANVNSQLASAAPGVTFAITTNGGANFSIAAATATLEGDGWIDVRDIAVNGQPLATPPVWTDFDSWQIEVPLVPGANAIALTALNFEGATVGTDTITVTNTTTVAPASASNLVISEIHYHPADPNGDAEFIELLNVSGATIDLGGVTFADGIAFTFPAGTQLAAGQRLVLSHDAVLFESLHGLAPFGSYTGKLANSGERILLNAADSTAIADITYGDNSPWPAEADGDGFSLVLTSSASDPTLPESWRVSATHGGNPGAGDSTSFSDDADADLDHDGITALLEHAFGTSDTTPNVTPFTFDGSVIELRLDRTADDITTALESSTDLTTWGDASPVLTLLTTQHHTDGTTTLRYQIADAVPRQFFRLRVTL